MIAKNFVRLVLMINSCFKSIEPVRLIFHGLATINNRNERAIVFDSENPIFSIQYAGRTKRVRPFIDNLREKREILRTSRVRN